MGGEAEGGRLGGWRTWRAPRSIARSLPLAELARVATLRRFVGHDSGITHLAAALELPCLVLWADSAEAIRQENTSAFSAQPPDCPA